VREALLLPCGYQFNANAVDGRSFGPEVEINAKLAERWLLALSGSYTDAKVTRPSTQLIWRCPRYGCELSDFQQLLGSDPERSKRRSQHRDYLYRTRV
jgi:hypothetical protein